MMVDDTESSAFCTPTRLGIPKLTDHPVINAIYADDTAIVVIARNPKERQLHLLKLN